MNRYVCYVILIALGTANLNCGKRMRAIKFGSFGSSIDESLVIDGDGQPEGPGTKACSVVASKGTDFQHVIAPHDENCRNVWNNLWVGICRGNSIAEITFDVYLDGPRIAGGTAYCRNGHPTYDPDGDVGTPEPNTQHCDVNTVSHGHTGAHVSAPFDPNCRTVFNNFWTTICNGNFRTDITFDLILNGNYLVRGGTAYCRNGHPTYDANDPRPPADPEDPTPPPTTPPPAPVYRCLGNGGQVHNGYESQSDCDLSWGLPAGTCYQDTTDLKCFHPPGR